MNHHLIVPVIQTTVLGQPKNKSKNEYSQKIKSFKIINKTAIPCENSETLKYDDDEGTTTDSIGNS